MASMFYDLCYGALKNAADDGVHEEWYLFKNTDHTNKDSHPLGSPFRSGIYLVNPSNTDWLNYFSQRVKEVYDVFDFDGFHIDQLGGRGNLYDYAGNKADLPAGFHAFIEKLKADFPDKKNAFNAVSGYGQSHIAAAKPDFLYNEIWNDQPEYADLKIIIDTNLKLNDKLNNVFAAYMNYDKARHKGDFNTPGVLMTDAIIFALGASHLELGEHILCSEYFPSNNLQPDKALQIALPRYYDFLVAYENILRDGGNFVDLTVGGNSVAAWPPKQGNIITLAKKIENRQVIHLFNFTNAAHLSWRDLNGTQTEPNLQQNIQLKIPVSQNATKAWTATPDKEGKIYEEIPFQQEQDNITITVSTLKYWTMIVVE
jgi:dextranase